MDNGKDKEWAFPRLRTLAVLVWQKFERKSLFFDEKEV